MNTSAVNLSVPKVPSFSQTFSTALPPVPRFSSPPLAPVVTSVVAPVRAPLEVAPALQPKPKTIHNWLRNNMGKVAAICLVLLITIILIARLVLMQRKNKKQREEEMKTVENDPEWESFFNGNNPQVNSPQPPPPQEQPSVYRQQQQQQQQQQQVQQQKLQQHQLQQQKLQQAFYEQSRLQQHAQPPLHFQPPSHSSQPSAQPEPVHQPRGKQVNEDATAPREENNRAGGRGIQNRFSPAENMHGGAGMPHSMMPESTRPIRETTSDSTFKVKPEDLLISPPKEAETSSSVASAKAPESAS